MTEYETQVLDSLQNIEFYLLQVKDTVLNIFSTIDGYFSVFFLPLLFLILSVLILKWISRW